MPPGRAQDGEKGSSSSSSSSATQANGGSSKRQRKNENDDDDDDDDNEDQQEIVDEVKPTRGTRITKFDYEVDVDGIPKRAREEAIMSQLLPKNDCKGIGIFYHFFSSNEDKDKPDRESSKKWYSGTLLNNNYTKKGAEVTIKFATDIVPKGSRWDLFTTCFNPNRDPSLGGWCFQEKAQNERLIRAIKDYVPPVRGNGNGKSSGKKAAAWDRPEQNARSSPRASAPSSSSSSSAGSKRKR